MANLSDQPLVGSPAHSHFSLAPENQPADSSSAAPFGGPADDELRRRAPGRAVTVDVVGHNHKEGSRKGTGNSRARSEPAPTTAGEKLRRMTTSLFTPEIPVAAPPGYLQSFKAALFSSWVNVLLVFIPIGWALHFAKSSAGISDTVVFIMTFISIIPLAGLLGFATEEVSMRLGQTLGGLVNATLGNTVELLISILALVKCEIDVVQSSLIGSILSNLLLVLGGCFVAGGFKYSEQSMKETASQLNMSLLLIATFGILVPSAFHFAFSSKGGEIETTDVEKQDILNMSHGVAVILLAIYVLFMLFQMWSHAHLYSDDETSQSTRYRPEIANLPGRAKSKALQKARRLRALRSKKSDEETVNEENKDNAENAPTRTVTQSSADSEDEEEVPQMNMPVTLIVMAIIAGITGVTAEFLVDSINGMVEANPSLSREFVGLILLPIVGNAAEHFTAISVAVKDKLDLSISVAVGSSIQVALFVVPVIQCLAWCINKPMTLLFDPFESVMLFFTVLIVNQTMADGRSNWMEGVVLICFYIVIAVAFWFYPGSEPLIACT